MYSKLLSKIIFSNPLSVELDHAFILDDGINWVAWILFEVDIQNLQGVDQAWIRHPIRDVVFKFQCPEYSGAHQPESFSKIVCFYKVLEKRERE